MAPQSGAEQELDRRRTAQGCAAPTAASLSCAPSCSPQPGAAAALATQPHLNLMPASGLKRLFMEFWGSTRTRTGTALSKAARGCGGSPWFHTTKISPAPTVGAVQWR